MVSCDRNFHASSAKVPGCFKRAAHSFWFSGGSHRGANDGNHIFRCKVRNNCLCTCGMQDGITQVKFLCNAHGCQNIVCSVRMKMRWNLTPEQRNKRLHVRLINIIASFLFNKIALCTGERAAHDCSCPHTRHWLTAFIFPIIALRVFPKRELDCTRGFERHFIYVCTCELNCGDLSADHVRAAGRNRDCGDACLPCLRNRRIKRIETVHRADIRRNRGSGLVAILPFPAQAFFRNADMRMCINQSGQNESACSIKRLTIIGRGILCCTTGRDNTIFKVHISCLKTLSFHGEQYAVCYSHKYLID